METEPGNIVTQICFPKVDQTRTTKVTIGFCVDKEERISVLQAYRILC